MSNEFSPQQSDDANEPSPMASSLHNTPSFESNGYGEQPYTAQQPGASQQPYGAQHSTLSQEATPPNFNGFGIAALILGIIGLGVSWIPFFGFAGVVVGLVGLTLGIIGLVLDRYRGKRALAVAGTSASALALLLSSFLPFFTGAWWLIDRIMDSEGWEQLEKERPWESDFTHTLEPYESPAPNPTTPETFNDAPTSSIPVETAPVEPTTPLDPGTTGEPAPTTP